MPVLSFPDGTDPKSLGPCSYLASVMIYPDDDKARDTFVRFVGGRGWEDFLLSEKATRVAVPAKLAGWLVGTPELDRADFDRRMRNGRAAGRILHFTVFNWLSADKRRLASLTHSVTVMSRVMGNVRGGDVQTLKRHVWKPFMPVAHLWAAALHLRDLQEMNRVEPPDKDIPRFLSIAEAFRRTGEEVRHSNSTSSLLDPASMWLPPENMELPGVTIELKGYEQAFYTD